MKAVITNTVYSRDDVDFVYIPVTRCGSTWLRHVFEHNNFKEYNIIENLTSVNDIPDIKDKIKLIVLRDPLERIISGMYAPEDFDLDTIYSREKIFTNFPTDIHTTPQIEFLKGISLDNAIFIEYKNSPNWGPNFIKLLIKIVPNFKKSPIRWEARVNGSSPKELLDIAKSNNVIYNNMMDYLKEDQLFFEQVNWHKWYGTN
jgi:hypothetical protein